MIPLEPMNKLKSTVNNFVSPCCGAKVLYNSICATCKEHTGLECWDCGAEITTEEIKHVCKKEK